MSSCVIPKSYHSGIVSLICSKFSLNQHIYVVLQSCSFLSLNFWDENILAEKYKLSGQSDNLSENSLHKMPPGQKVLLGRQGTNHILLSTSFIHSHYTSKTRTSVIITKVHPILSEDVVWTKNVIFFIFPANKQQFIFILFFYHLNEFVTTNH